MRPRSATIGWLFVLLVPGLASCARKGAGLPAQPEYRGVIEYDYHPPPRFYPCSPTVGEERSAWAVVWTDSALQDLRTALQRQRGDRYPTSRDRFWVRIRATVSDTGHYGSMGWEPREIRVSRLPTVRLLASRNGDDPSADEERDRLCR